MEKVDPSTAAKNFCSQNVDSLALHVKNMIREVENNNLQNARVAFNQSRKYYKRTEALTEFYFPSVSKSINGPAIDKLEEEDEKIIEATGFQVIEEILFAEESKLSSTSELKQDILILEACITRLKGILSNTEFNNANIFEALRLQLLRIASLGLSGFDSPVQLNSLNEAIESLDGIRTIMSFFPKHENESWILLKENIHSCQTFLTSSDFNKIDRAKFITVYFNPLCKSFLRFQNESGIKHNEGLSALFLENENFFSADIFNVNFFSHDPTVKYGDKVRQLGQLLFFDPILSGNNKRACASCHKPSQAFSDGNDRSSAFNFNGKVKRNTPTLINSAFQQNQFWDGRVAYIEDQVSQVISNTDEMHSHLTESVHRMRDSKEYHELFSEAFGASTGNSITELRIQKALAVYVRSLNGLNSRFDNYMRGNKTSMTRAEINGLNLFMGKAKCGTCHFMPLFNGSVPPTFKETEAEALGVPAKPDFTAASIDRDRGKFYNFPHPLLDNMFKTPSIRNAALTAPYMHNGIYQTLEEVLEFYNEGGGAGIGIELKNQTLPSKKLNLSEIEKKEVILFIESLTDTTNLTGKPVRLPRIDNPSLNKRTLGGEY